MKLFGNETSNVNQVKRGGVNQPKNKGGKFDTRQETKKTTEWEK